jgi:saccharopine dehydrogenase-like NADP-dependent oxidoreductase
MRWVSLLHRGATSRRIHTKSSSSSAAPPRVLVLGGYGEFGSRICGRLASGGKVQVVVAGRDANKALNLARQLNAGQTEAKHAVEGIAMDVNASAKALAARLRDLNVRVAVHTCGPFLPNQYAVAQACVEAGVHYVVRSEWAKIGEGGGGGGGLIMDER